MAEMYVIGEDALSCALGVKLVTDVAKRIPALPVINTHGVTKLQSALKRYFGLVNISPVLCVADTDGKCVVDIIQRWIPHGTPSGFLLRFAVREAESWLLADSEAFADFLHVPQSKMPKSPDEIDNPKEMVLHLASRSSKRLIRQEMVSDRDSSKSGAGYNVHLCDFAAQYWRPLEAARVSPSLSRAIDSLSNLAV